MAQRWYSVSVLSNFEKKIAETIRTSVEEQGLEEQIGVARADRAEIRGELAEIGKEARCRRIDV